MNVSSPPIDSDDNGFVVGVSVVQDALNMFQTASLDTTGSSQDKVLVDASIIKSLQKLVVYAPNGVGTRVLCEIGTLHKILRFLDYDTILKSVVFVSKTFWKAAKKAAQENLREIQDGASEDFGQRLETHMLQQQLQQALQGPPFPPLYRLKSAHEIHLYDMELPSRGPYEVSSDGRVAILDEHDRRLRIFDAANGREIVSEPAAQKEVKKWDFGTRGTLVQSYQWPELLWKGGYLFLRGPNKIIIWNEKNLSLHGIVDLEAIGENSWTDWDVALDGTIYVVNAFDRGTGMLQRGEIVSWNVHGVRERVSFAWRMENEYEDVRNFDASYIPIL